MIFLFFLSKRSNNEIRKELYLGKIKGGKLKKIAYNIIKCHYIKNILELIKIKLHFSKKDIQKTIVITLLLKNVTK